MGNTSRTILVLKRWLQMKTDYTDWLYCYANVFAYVCMLCFMYMREENNLM